MGSRLDLLTDPDTSLVADASAVINLIATQYAARIIAALPSRLVVVDAVVSELESGRSRGRTNADALSELTAAGLVEIVQLGDAAMQHFEQLIEGPAVMTLDDGEAATIGYCVAHGGIAIIDERKASRICGQRFPELRIGCTVGILAHPAVQRGLGDAGLAEAVFNALLDGRMRVFPNWVEWVVTLIGEERPAMC
ncbi:MAG: hypothetical protein EHM18_09790, partial [Acidobacteria bacterium]